MPRGKDNCCEEVVKLKLKRFGHVKCSHDRKPRHKEGKWLNHVMGEKMFKDENLYRVCDQFVRKNQSSTEHGKSNSFLRIQNNQPKIVGLVKVSMDGEETQKSPFVHQNARNQVRLTPYSPNFSKISNLGKSSWIYPTGGGEIE